jgi:hypothetical protein
MGTVFSYTSTALPDMREAGDFGTVSEKQESWIGALALVST